MGKLFEVLLLPLPELYPGIARHVCDGISLADDVRAPFETSVQHTVQAVRFLDVTLHRIREPLGGVLDEVMILAGHGTEPSHLPEQPFQCRLAPTQVGGYEFADLVGEINQDSAPDSNTGIGSPSMGS